MGKEEPQQQPDFYLRANRPGDLSGTRGVDICSVQDPLCAEICGV